MLGLYPNCGKRDRARELAEMMPFMAMSKDFLVSHVETGDRKYDALMNKCFMLLQFLANETVSFNVKLDLGKMAFTTEERIVMRDKSIALIHLFFENGDYGFFNTILQDAHSAQAWCYAKKLDRDNTLSHLKAAGESAVAFIEYVNAPDFRYSSLVFRGKEKDSFSTNGSNNHALSLLNKLSDGCYDFVRGEPEFAALEDKLREYAGKWEPEQS